MIPKEHELPQNTDVCGNTFLTYLDRSYRRLYNIEDVYSERKECFGKESTVMEMKKQKIDFRKYIGMVFFLVIGGVCGWFFGYYLGETVSEGAGPGETLMAVGLLLLGFYVMLYLQIVIHEAGHLVFGLVTGYRFLMFRIGSLTLLRDPDSGKVRIKRMQLAGTGGQCLLVPPVPVDGRIPFALYHLGGSLMNLIASAVFFVLYLVSRPIPTLSLIMLVGVIVGIAFALMNGIPMRLGAIDNDGYNFLSQTKSAAAMEAMRIQLLIVAESAKGIRLRGMPSAWFEIPEGWDSENSLIAVIRVFACNRLMDEGRYAETEEAIRTLLGEKTGIIGIHRSLLLCDRATCLLLLGRVSEADALLTKELKAFMKAMKTNPSILRSQYAFARLSQKDPKLAESVRHDFDRCAAKHPYPADIESELDILTAIDAAADKTV